MATVTSPSPRIYVPQISHSRTVIRSGLAFVSRRLGGSKKEHSPRYSVECIRSMSAEGSTQEVEVPRSVPVRVAHELLQAGHRYLDVRTPEEFSAGRPVGAVNIPYMFKVGAGMSKNPKFLEAVSSTFDKDDEIVVGCLSGKRSLMAATDLAAAGFTGVTDVAGGYSSWVQNELPSENSG